MPLSPTPNCSCYCFAVPKYRIAFGAWINDMRRDPLPLENWPAPQLDDEAVASAIAAMDLQSAAGYNMLDVWGLFATYGWPPDIVSAVDKDRRQRIHKLLAAAKQRRLLQRARRNEKTPVRLIVPAFIQPLTGRLHVNVLYRAIHANLPKNRP